MRADFFEYTPNFKLMIAGNHKPTLRSVDEAILLLIHEVHEPSALHSKPVENRDA